MPVWLVDYDLQAKPASRRVAFYNARKKLIAEALKESGLEFFRSSQSVVITSSEQLARKMCELAKFFGARTANLYRLGDMVQEA